MGILSFRGKYRKAVPKPRQKRGYHSSSDDDSDADEAQNTVPLIPQAKKAKASLESKKSDSPSKATTSSKKAEPAKKPPPPKEKQRYYSSSSEDDEDNTPAQKSASNQKFLSNLESFNSGFWMDSDKEEGGESGEEEDDDDRRLGESRSDYQSRKAKESKQFETEENLSTTEIKSAGEAIALSSKNQAAQSDTNAKRLQVSSYYCFEWLEHKSSRLAFFLFLQALKKRQEELNKSKLVIKTSLSHVDSTKNKKIVFDTESKNDGDLLRKGNGIITRNLSSKIMQNWKKLFSFSEASAKPKAQLFDGGDSSDEESQADDFKIRSQFHGESGEKNLSLQARFASDSR